MTEFKLRAVFIQADKIVCVNPTYEIEMLSPSEINLAFVSVIKPRSVTMATNGILFGKKEIVEGTGVTVGATEYLVRMPIKDFKSKYTESAPN